MGIYRRPDSLFWWYKIELSGGRDLEMSLPMARATQPRHIERLRVVLVMALDQVCAAASFAARLSIDNSIFKGCLPLTLRFESKVMIGRVSSTKFPDSLLMQSFSVANLHVVRNVGEIVEKFRATTPRTESTLPSPHKKKSCVERTSAALTRSFDEARLGSFRPSHVSRS